MGFFDDMLQMKMDAQLRDHSRQLEAISNHFNQLTSGVNELFEMLEEVKGQEIEFFTEFQVYEAFDELNTRYDRFWQEANNARDRHKQNGDWGQFNNAIETRLHQLALDYVEPAGKLSANIPNVLAFCMIWPAVNEETEKSKKHLDFDYSEFSEIDFDPNILHNLRENLFDAYNSMSALGDNLIEEWVPFGDYEDNGWKEEFDSQLREFQGHASQIEKYSDHVRSLFRSLWEIKKQVELAKGAGAQGASDDAITRIEKLAALMEKGLITQEEYDEKKRKLLEEI